jgi:hypothetical protein
VPSLTGVPDATNTNTWTVLQSVARLWVSGGANDLDMSNSNVLIMYYSALQSLTFTTGAATSTAAQRKWFPALAALTRAFAALHESEAAYRKVTKAMVSGASGGGRREGWERALDIVPPTLLFHMTRPGPRASLGHLIHLQGCDGPGVYH